MHAGTCSPALRSPPFLPALKTPPPPINPRATPEAPTLTSEASCRLLATARGASWEMYAPPQPRSEEAAGLNGTHGGGFKPSPESSELAQKPPRILQAPTRSLSVPFGPTQELCGLPRYPRGLPPVFPPSSRRFRSFPPPLAPPADLGCRRDVPGVGQDETAELIEVFDGSAPLFGGLRGFGGLEGGGGAVILGPPAIPVRLSSPPPSPPTRHPSPPLT